MKSCSYCQIEKDLVDFSKDRSSADGYDYQCRICRAATTKRYRNNNLEFCKELTRQNTKRILVENTTYLIELKSNPCVLCGKQYTPECMDFDHIDPSTKSFEIGHCFWKSMRRELIDAELLKCRLLCCYCHANITYAARSPNKSKYIAKKRALINEIKENNPCAMCGLFFDHWKMQFDHLDASTKLDAISNLVAKSAWNVVLSEIEKCQLLCIGCHRIITKKRQETTKE